VVKHVVNNTVTKGGDEFQLLYQNEVRRVWQYFRRRGVSESDTADLVQEVFVRTYSGWEKFVPDNRVAWLFGFVWRVYCEHVRKRVREILGGDLDEFESGIAHDERCALVTLELDKLKKGGALTPLAEQVLNAKLQGKSVREIADELSQPAWQVREVYEKTVQVLRERLGARGAENPPSERTAPEGPQIPPAAVTDVCVEELPSETDVRAPSSSGYFLIHGLSESRLLLAQPSRLTAKLLK
jgi:DNA-directed RNA polymerase specialized sigma24 family protein